MNDKKRFLYTVLVFLAMVLVSYIAGAQPKKLSLEEAISGAITNNRQIKIARLGLDASQQQVIVSKSMALPKIDFTVQANHYFMLPVFFGLNGNGSDDKIGYGRFGGADQAAAGVSLVQPLYNAAIRPAIEQSKLYASQSGLSVSEREIAIAALVKQSYLQILVLSERIKLQNESLNRNQKALKDARSLLQQGRALRVDTLRAYISVKNLEPDLMKLSYYLDIENLRLKTLIGVDSLQEIQLSDSLTLPAPDNIPSEEQVLLEAKKNRPDLKIFELQQQIDDRQIAITEAYRKPTVALTGQYLLQTQAKQFNYGKAFYPSTSYIGILAAVPIFNGFANKARIRTAQINQRQSVLQLTDAYQQLSVEVKEVVANMTEAAARIQNSITVKESAMLSYEITQYRYAKGVASRLELTDVELALTTAQSNYLEAVYTYLYARIALDRTTGIVNTNFYSLKN